MSFKFPHQPKANVPKKPNAVNPNAILQEINKNINQSRRIMRQDIAKLSKKVSEGTYQYITYNIFDADGKPMNSVNRYPCTLTIDLKSPYRILLDGTDAGTPGIILRESLISFA